MKLFPPRLAYCLAAFLLAGVTAGAYAHHSTAIYDSENPIELSGKVVKWKFTNPHCIIELEVTDDTGATSIWGVEGSNTSMLFRRGWTPDTLKPGDMISVTVRPLRSGALGGNYSNPRWQDGTSIDPAAAAR